MKPDPIPVFFIPALKSQIGKIYYGAGESPCMENHPIVPVIAIVILFLIFSSPVLAFGDSLSPSLFMAVNIAQERHLFTANVDDKIKIANQAAQQGDYQRSVEVYTLAEDQWEHDHQNDKNWYYYDHMVMMERHKANVLNQWGGHEGAAAAAEDNIKEYSRLSSEAAVHERSECLITTATYGSPMAGEVQLVRDYRDGTIGKSYSGSRFVVAFNAWYYSFSPAVAGFIDENPVVKPIMRIYLAPLIGIVIISRSMYPFLAFMPEFATVTILVFGSALYGLIYTTPLVLAVLWLARRAGWKLPGPARMMPVLGVWTVLLALLTLSVLFSVDTLAIISSGLLVACTIVLSAGTVSLSTFRYLGLNRPVRI